MKTSKNDSIRRCIFRFFTMPFLETVAGEALSIFDGSKTTLHVEDIGILSPLASVRVLLSSSTEFKFSIQMASTGPSNISQTCSPKTEHMYSYTIDTYYEVRIEIGNP